MALFYKNISDLDPAGALSDSDSIEVLQGGVNKELPILDLRADTNSLIQDFNDSVIDPKYEHLLLIKKVERAQSIQSGRSASGRYPDFLAISASQVNILAGDTDPELVLAIASGKNSGFGNMDFEISLSDIDGIIDPSEWDFTSSAAGIWRLYVELNITDPENPTVSYGKWNAGAAGSEKFIENLISDSDIPYTPQSGDQYYNRHERTIKRYSGSSWESKTAIHIGSVACDGAGNLSDLVMYDFKAVTKIDNTEFVSDGRYQYYHGYGIDVRSTLVDGLNYVGDLSAYCHKNTLAIWLAWAVRDSARAVRLLTLPGDVTGAGLIWATDIEMDGSLGQWADEGSNNQNGGKTLHRLDENGVLTVIELSSDTSYYRNKLSAFLVKE